MSAAVLDERVRLEAAIAPPSDNGFLNLRLAAWDALSPLARKVLTAEAAAIWGRSHVQLRWLTTAESAVSGPTLRVLITPGAVATRGDSQRWPVGELLRFDDSVAVAVASVAGAQQIVAQSDFVQIFETPDHRDYRLGLILGRAVAHEIGHYLLRTDTHAQVGLMRATIAAREFADLHTSAFDLDGEATAHLAALSATTSQTAARFSYSR